jgi:arabinose-5-phosphate isomerase
MKIKKMKIEDLDNRIKDIINNFTYYINYLKFDNLEDCIKVMMNCKGKIVTTGMGKAGIIMRKFSSTLCSFGIPSCYLHPGEASHGDLGVIQKNDILFVASTSGKTREVLEIIDLSRNISNVKIIGITSHPDSKIRSKADIILDMGIIEEAGKMKLAPTTSIIIMQVITDVISIILSEEKNVTKKQFGKFHHSGYLGAVARNDNNIY